MLHGSCCMIMLKITFILGICIKYYSDMSSGLILNFFSFLFFFLCWFIKCSFNAKPFFIPKCISLPNSPARSLNQAYQVCHIHNKNVHAYEKNETEAENWAIAGHWDFQCSLLKLMDHTSTFTLKLLLETNAILYIR